MNCTHGVPLHEDCDDCEMMLQEEGRDGEPRMRYVMQLDQAPPPDPPRHSDQVVGGRTSGVGDRDY